MREIQTSTTLKILEVFKFIVSKVFPTFFKVFRRLAIEVVFTLFTRLFLRARQFVVKNIRNIENEESYSFRKTCTS